MHSPKWYGDKEDCQMKLHNFRANLTVKNVLSLKLFKTKAINDLRLFMIQLQAAFTLQVYS